VQANLLHYLRGEAAERIPIWRMIAATTGELAERAGRLVAHLGPLGQVCALLPGRSTVGGGSLPEETLPTTSWPCRKPRRTARRLRRPRRQWCRAFRMGG
jgi:L-seryl-tRNA(Ser) seleniumtransferase